MKPNQITIHHTASKRNTSFEVVNQWHKDRFNFISLLGFYVGYHYLITEDGEVTQARKDTELGAHSVPNDGKIGICLTGNFNEEMPSEMQIKSLEELTERLKREYNISEVKAHRDVPGNRTECPGNNLYALVKDNFFNNPKKLILEIKERVNKLEQML